MHKTMLQKTLLVQGIKHKAKDIVLVIEYIDENGDKAEYYIKKTSKDKLIMNKEK